MTERTNAPAACATKGEALRQQVIVELRCAIEQGTFAPGTRLPPSRAQALTLGVSRNIVLWALERLQAEGYDSTSQRLAAQRLCELLSKK